MRPAEDFKYFNESSRDDDGGIIGEVLDSDWSGRQALLSDVQLASAPSEWVKIHSKEDVWSLSLGWQDAYSIIMTSWCEIKNVLEDVATVLQSSGHKNQVLSNSSFWSDDSNEARIRYKDTAVLDYLLQEVHRTQSHTPVQVCCGVSWKNDLKVDRFVAKPGSLWSVMLRCSCWVSQSPSHGDGGWVSLIPCMGIPWKLPVIPIRPYF
jgi:hypothetical protein